MPEYVLHQPMLPLQLANNPALKHSNMRHYNQYYDENGHQKVYIFETGQLAIELLSPWENGIWKVESCQSAPSNDVIHLGYRVVDPSIQIIFDLGSHIPEVRYDSQR